MDKEQKPTVQDLRPGFINLWEISGINFEEKTVTRDPDFSNPKATLRAEVLATLATASTPEDIPAIEIYVDKGGTVELLDGDHRVINALIKCDGNQDSPWMKIKAARFKGSRLDAQLRALTSNLGSGRSNLNESEIVGVVERCKAFGMTHDEIVTKIGRGSKHFITKIESILHATPEVLDAVKKGEIDVVTGSRLAKHELGAQPELLDKVIEAKVKAGGNERTARIGTGISTRTTTLRLESIRELLWPYYEQYKFIAEQGGPLSKHDEDQYTWGYVGALLRVLQLPPKDGNRQQSDNEPMECSAIFAVLDPLYEQYSQALKNPPRPRAKKKG